MHRIAANEISTEIPANLCLLNKITEAVTEHVVKILASHNPRIRSRYDRFDVATAFRPCSDIYFDPNHVRTDTGSEDWNKYEENSAAIFPCLDQEFNCDKRAERLANDTPANSKEVAAIENTIRARVPQSQPIKHSHLEAMADGNKPRRRLLTRLLGCFGKSET